MKLRQVSVSVWLMVLFFEVGNAQTTEQTRLYGTFNINRNSAYDDPRNRYASSGSSYSYGSPNYQNSSANKDTIYWERTREQLRNQYGINTDRYSPNWGSNDRVSDSRNLNSDQRSQNYDPLRNNPIGYDSRNPSYSRYPSSDPRSSVYDSRNQNYDSKNLFDSKVPNFEQPGLYQPQGASATSVTSTYDRDRGSQSNWERDNKERERERELERDRSYYLNSRTRVNTNTNPINQNYGSNNPRTKLPGKLIYFLKLMKQEN